MTAESIIDACKPLIEKENLEAEFHVFSSLPEQFQASAKAAVTALEGAGVLVRIAVCDVGELEVWFPLSGKHVISRVASESEDEIIFNMLGKFESPHDIPWLLEAEYDEFMDDSGSNMDNDDRINCPFCGHMHYPGSKRASQGDWNWNDDICEHTLFVAFVDPYSTTTFEFRSKLFNQNLGLPDSNETKIEIPSLEEEDEFMGVEEIIGTMNLPSMQILVYTDGGGMACGPCGGGSITFGFVPDHNPPQQPE